MNIELLLNEVNSLKGINIPDGKAAKKRLTNALKTADGGMPLQIYVGSCPDYSHNNNKYTHKGLGESVPLLSQYHIQKDTPFLAILNKHGVPYDYTIMIADVEATDEYFCQKFADGSEEEFLRRCYQSMEKTSQALKSLELSNQLRSSSFFQEFGRGRFMEHQYSYQELLKVKFSEDDSFRSRVIGDITARISLYRTMYPDVFRSGLSDRDLDEYLTDRTIRTMAQYLTLGRLIAEQPNPVIINHPTRNMSMFNDRNKYLLPTDGPQPQPTIPILEMTKSVY